MMKLTQVTMEQLASMTWEQKWNFNCGGIRDEGRSASVAILLGGKPIRAVERARGALQLYREGRVKYIVPSGGVRWEYEGETLSECELMTRILIEGGVPEEAIIPENEATTTKENMIYATLQINRKTGLRGFDHIIIVTSQSHMKRSLALARAFLPRKFTVSGYPSYPEQTKEEWLADEENQKILDGAIRLMKGLVDNGIVEDMEIDL
jgi:uncharacterized SAM-binding protein YcdF (DUF218 family)